MKSLKKLFGLCGVVVFVSLAVTFTAPALNRVLESSRADSLQKSAVSIDALASGADSPVFPADPRNKSTADVFAGLVGDGYVSAEELRALHSEKFQFARVAESDRGESILLVSRPHALKAGRIVVNVRGNVTLTGSGPAADLLP